MSEKFQIKYLNNDGGGFAETCELEPGTSVAQFLEKKGVSPAQYKIRLRRKLNQVPTRLTLRSPCCRSLSL